MHTQHSGAAARPRIARASARYAIGDSRLGPAQDNSVALALHNWRRTEAWPNRLIAALHSPNRGQPFHPHIRERGFPPTSSPLLQVRQAWPGPCHSRLPLETAATSPARMTAPRYWGKRVSSPALQMPKPALRAAARGQALRLAELQVIVPDRPLKTADLRRAYGSANRVALAEGDGQSERTSC